MRFPAAGPPATRGGGGGQMMMLQQQLLSFRIQLRLLVSQGKAMRRRACEGALGHRRSPQTRQLVVRRSALLLRRAERVLRAANGPHSRRARSQKVLGQYLAEPEDLDKTARVSKAQFSTGTHCIRACRTRLPIGGTTEMRRSLVVRKNGVSTARCLASCRSPSSSRSTSAISTSNEAILDYNHQLQSRRSGCRTRRASVRPGNCSNRAFALDRRGRILIPAVL